MISLREWGVVSMFLGLYASAALIISVAAPYVANDDELVYLLGAEYSHGVELPDVPMLRGYDYGPYLYPIIMHMVYEKLGFTTFKIGLLILLIFSTGWAAYFCFRLLLLPHVESIFLMLVGLLPRVATGTEFFGVLTFREAIGRSLAVPLFFVATAWIVHHVIHRKATWPTFLCIGIFSFLHPVTVLLFAAIMLVGVGCTYVWRDGPSWSGVTEVLRGGIAYLIGASYFLVEVVIRLYTSSTHVVPVNAGEYVEAVLFRNSWEFPQASMGWIMHLLIVSSFFIFGALLVTWCTRNTSFPRHSQVGTLSVFGVSVLIASLTFAVILPGLNLYAMKFYEAPYLFQQWSRIGKFFYIGLFVAIIPVVYILGQWVRSIPHGRTIATFLLIAGILSSSFFFEIAQFLVGYKNVTKEYIPQYFSSIPDDVTPQEYREVCGILRTRSTALFPKVISNDFAFRYYCHADLFATLEEGAAYLQLPRDSFLGWFRNYTKQRTVLREANPSEMILLAQETDSEFIVLPRAERYLPFIKKYPHAVFGTQNHIVIEMALLK